MGEKQCLRSTKCGLLKPVGRVNRVDRVGLRMVSWGQFESAGHLSNGSDPTNARWKKFCEDDYTGHQ